MSSLRERVDRARDEAVLGWAEAVRPQTPTARNELMRIERYYLLALRDQRVLNLVGP